MSVRWRATDADRAVVAYFASRQVGGERVPVSARDNPRSMVQVTRGRSRSLPAERVSAREWGLLGIEGADWRQVQECVRRGQSIADHWASGAAGRAVAGGHGQGPARRDLHYARVLRYFQEACASMSEELTGQWFAEWLAASTEEAPNDPIGHSQFEDMADAVPSADVEGGQMVAGPSAPAASACGAMEGADGQDPWTEEEWICKLGDTPSPVGR